MKSFSHSNSNGMNKMNSMPKFSQNNGGNHHSLNGSNNSNFKKLNVPKNVTKPNISNQITHHLPKQVLGGNQNSQHHNGGNLAHKISGSNVPGLGNLGGKLHVSVGNGPSSKHCNNNGNNNHHCNFNHLSWFYGSTGYCNTYNKCSYNTTTIITVPVAVPVAVPVPVAGPAQQLDAVDPTVNAAPAAASQA